jgi:hypothetical protein
MRRRLFNAFAFACLAFALYLIAFSKEEQTVRSSRQTAHHTTASKAVSEKGQ